MISIEDKQQCCGCAACSDICPKKCITMGCDAEGYPYPVIDRTKCIDCGVCEKTCPELNVFEGTLPMEVMAAKSHNEQIRSVSSSGGLFSLLAESIISDGGVVFGAKFDDHWTAVHSAAQDIAGLAPLKSSKYIQSLTAGTFAEVRRFLNEGRKVMYCGTPCQVAGLRLFLKKENPNLLLVDFVCHGVPSPKVWQSYLESIATREQIKGISFRSKSNGWKSYCMKLTLPAEASASCSSGPCAGEERIQTIEEPYYNNCFMNSFLSNVNLRPSCYACPAKGKHSAADITLGDFWGIDKIQPDFDDDKGTSLIIPRSERGREAMAGIIFDSINIPTAEAIRYNPSLMESVNKPAYRDYFFKKFKKTGNFMAAYDAVFSKTLAKRVSRRLWLKFSGR